MRFSNFFKKLTFIGLTGCLTAGGFAACHHRGNPGQRMLEHLDDTIDDLDLSVDQQTRYKVLRTKIEQEFTTVRTQHKILAQTLQREFSKDEANIELVADSIKKHHRERNRQFDKFPDFMVEFYQILDAEQKKEINKKVNKHISRFLSHIE